ncbi:MAG: hypothetical protein ABIE84_00600 [bacterium]
MSSAITYANPGNRVVNALRFAALYATGGKNVRQAMRTGEGLPEKVCRGYDAALHNNGTADGDFGKLRDIVLRNQVLLSAPGTMSRLQDSLETAFLISWHEVSIFSISQILNYLSPKRSGQVLLLTVLEMEPTDQYDNLLRTMSEALCLGDIISAERVAQIFNVLCMKSTKEKDWTPINAVLLPLLQSPAFRSGLAEAVLDRMEQRYAGWLEERLTG